MRVYGRHMEMEFSTGTLPPITFTNGYADLDDELASRLLLDFPERFRQTPFDAHEMWDQRVALDPDALATDTPAVDEALTVDAPDAPAAPLGN